jgi:hypothetical protein
MLSQLLPWSTVAWIDQGAFFTLLLRCQPPHWMNSEASDADYEVFRDSGTNVSHVTFGEIDHDLTPGWFS